MIDRLRTMLANAEAETIREDALMRRRRSPSKHLLRDITHREAIREAAVDALPALLDVAEAAKQITQAAKREDFDRLRSALAKLETT